MARLFDRNFNDGSSSDDDEDYVPPEQVEVEGDSSESGEADLEPSSGGDTDVDVSKRKRKRKIRVASRNKKKRKSDDSYDETTSNEALPVPAVPTRSSVSISTETHSQSSASTGNVSTSSASGGETSPRASLSSKEPLTDISDQVAEPAKFIPKLNKPAHATPLGALLASKKKKTTFDAVKEGWQKHVQETGMAEELAQHNKGKDGYLNRKDFLEQANYNEYLSGLKSKTGGSSKRTGH